MQVFVTATNGRKYTVEIESEKSIAHLKANVAEQAGVPAEHVRLFWEHAKTVVDELQDDESTCREVGIMLETELRMAVRTGADDSDDPVEEAWVAMNEALAEMTRLRDSFGKAREELRRSQEKLASQKEALQQRNEGKIKDKIKVQTSTLLISTRRSVLGFFPRTRLAALVSGCYDSEFLKADGKPFFDENSECFRELARFLSQCKETPADQALPPLPTGPLGLEIEMAAMLSNFGITEAYGQSQSGSAEVPEGQPPRGAGRARTTAAPEANQHQSTGRHAPWDVPTSTHQLEAAMELQKGALAAAFGQHAELVAEFEADQQWAKRYLKTPGCPASTSEVVQLDVSGVLVRTTRRTLTLCSGSALAQRFENSPAAGAEQPQTAQAREGESSDEDSEEEDDEDEATVIAEDPQCFLKILDHLRVRAAAATLDAELPPPTVPTEKEKEFAEVVAEYFPGKESFIFGRVAAPVAASWCTAWNPAMKSSMIDIGGEGNLVATMARGDGDGRAAFGVTPLPTSGRHYWEVVWIRPDSSTGSRVSYIYVGVITASRAKERVEKGCYGVAGSWQLTYWADGDSLKQDGKSMGISMPGRFAYGDRVGVLADRDAGTLTFYRNGSPIPKAVVPGVPREQELLILAGVHHGGESVTLSFPV